MNFQMNATWSWITIHAFTVRLDFKKGQKIQVTILPKKIYKSEHVSILNVIIGKCKLKLQKNHYSTPD